MEFRTEIPAPSSAWNIENDSQLLFMGSCFAENIGQKLEEQKMKTLINPFGVMYNPVSLARSVRRIVDNAKASDRDLIQLKDLWASFNFHSCFSGLDKGQVLWSINNATEKAHEFLKKTNYLVLTLGTAWVYILQSTDEIIANCHKVPEKHFMRERLSIDDIRTSLKSIADDVVRINPELKIILTVSPIRHWKDGAHQNQLSKASLLLAIEKLVQEEVHVEYFPAYEFQMDDLRDYRFYKKNLLHPNGEAVEYIWTKFKECYFSEDAHTILGQVASFIKAAHHRPFNRLSESHQKFVRIQLVELKEFHKKHPHFDFEEEIHLLQSQLR